LSEIEPIKRSRRMSLPYLIDKDLRIVFCKYKDTPVFYLWAEQIGAVFLDPGFEAGFDYIFDCSIVKTAPTKEFIEKLIIGDGSNLLRSMYEID
jgi:hypothetical protein